MDDDYTDPIELRRETLVRRQRFILTLLAPACAWWAYRYAGDGPVLTGAARGLLAVIELLVGLAWSAALLINTTKLDQLPKVALDEFERSENLHRLADGFVSTIVLIVPLTLISVFVEFSATAFGFLFYAVALVSLRFPIARAPFE